MSRSKKPLEMSMVNVGDTGTEFPWRLLVSKQVCRLLIARSRQVVLETWG